MSPDRRDFGRALIGLGTIALTFGIQRFRAAVFLQYPNTLYALFVRVVKKTSGDVPNSVEIAKAGVAG